MPKISKTSKMKIVGKRVGSWSLEAGVTCPMAKDSEVCADCYAKKNTYRFPVVKAVRAYNRDDYKKNDWQQRMKTVVGTYDYFRLFDSGDCETHLLARKLQDVIQATPHTKWWFPTRMDKSPKMQGILGDISKLSNVAVRYSADNVGLSKPERPGVNSYVIRPEDIPEAKKRNIFICPVTIPSSTQKSCDWCTHCYGDEDVAYILH